MRTAFSASPSAPALTTWLRRIQAQHRAIAEAGRRREAEAAARHPGR